MSYSNAIGSVAGSLLGRQSSSAPQMPGYNGNMTSAPLFGVQLPHLPSIGGGLTPTPSLPAPPMPQPSGGMPAQHPNLINNVLSALHLDMSPFQAGETRLAQTFPMLGKLFGWGS